jgi:hypothetical protein
MEVKKDTMNAVKKIMNGSAWIPATGKYIYLLDFKANTSGAESANRPFPHTLLHGDV